VSQGFHLTKLIIGSNYNLGFLFEALLQMQPVTSSEGHITQISLQTQDIITVLKGW
jgi:hypothetical protein